jgi:hypothetical protein
MAIELHIPRQHKTGRIVVADEVLDYGENGQYVKFHTVGGFELENGMLPPEETGLNTLPLHIFEKAYPPIYPS